MIKEAISKLVERIDLSQEEMGEVTLELMEARATPSQIGAFLTSLRMKGESSEEITQAAKVMREKVLRINAPKGLVVDTCGTGGDGSHTFNISTLAALVAAGASVTIAKHGNFSISSRCGSADLLLALGVNVEASKEVVERCLSEIGIGFLFAPLLHPLMRHVSLSRREIGIRTIFNLLGPLTNPAGAQAQLIGVYDDSLTEIFAQVLRNLGEEHALIVWGGDGLDEITLTTKTKVTELRNGEIHTYWITPEDFGLKRGSLEELRGGDPKENAEIALAILKGKRGTKRDVVLLNAAAAIILGKRASNLKEGIEMASWAIDSGKAMEKLRRLVELTNG